MPILPLAGRGCNAWVGIDVPICQDKRLGCLRDVSAHAEVCHNTLVDFTGEEAFEAADDLASGPAASRPAGDVVDRRLVEPHADDDRAMEGGVRLSVPAPIETMPAGRHPGRSRDRTGTAQLRKGGFCANPVGVVAEDDQHLGGRVGADTEALQERGRRLGREAGEVLVVRRDLLSQGKPATGKRPEGVLGGGGGRVERARSEGGAAREQMVIGEGVEGFSQVGWRIHDDRLQRDHRRGACFPGRIPRDLELPDHLDDTVPGFGGRGRLAGACAGRC